MVPCQGNRIVRSGVDHCLLSLELGIKIKCKNGSKASQQGLRSNPGNMARPAPGKSPIARNWNCQQHPPNVELGNCVRSHIGDEMTCMNMCRAGSGAREAELHSS